MLLIVIAKHNRAEMLNSNSMTGITACGKNANVVGGAYSKAS